MAPPAGAEYLYLRGKVAKNDGSPPGKLVLIEEQCAGGFPGTVATAGKSEEYLWRAESSFLGVDFPGLRLRECVLRAELPGYYSTALDLTG